MMKKIIFFVALTLFFNKPIAKFDVVDFFIDPNNQVNEHHFKNLSSAFEFLDKMGLFKELQVNFWFSNGDIFNFPNSVKIENISQIKFSSSDNNSSNSNEKATILFDSSSKGNLSLLNLTIDNINLIFNESTNPFVFRQAKIYFISVRISANLTQYQNSLFLVVDTNIWMKDVVLFDSYIKNNSNIFLILTNSNYEFSLSSENFFIFNNNFDTASLFSFKLDGLYAINFQNSIFMNSDFISSSQIFSINTAAKNNSDSFIIRNLNVKNLTIFSNSYFIFIATLQKTSSTTCYFISNFTNFYFVNNKIISSEFFHSENHDNECIFHSFFQNILISNNDFIKSTFLKIPSWILTGIKCINNTFDRSFLLENSFNKMAKPYIPEKILSFNDSFIGKNLFSEISLMIFQFTTSVIILDSFFIDNNSGFLIYILSNQLLNIQNCTFMNSVLRFYISMNSVEKISIIDNIFSNSKESNNENSNLKRKILKNSFSQTGGCISVTSFSNLIVKRLSFFNLTARNTNLFEILRDNSEEVGTFIKQLEVNDSVIVNNTFSSLLYSVSIFNLMIAQFSQSEFIFNNNSFTNNKLISKTPNQINNAICFLLMSLNSTVRIENLRVMNKKLGTAIFQSSLLYINTNTIILISSTFIGKDSSNSTSLILNHIKLFATTIKIYDCYFYKLGGESGGALFLSSIGSLEEYSTIFINNSHFIQNNAEDGGGIYFNEPDYFDNITLAYCNFSDNVYDGGHFSLSYSRYSDDDDADPLFFIINYCNFNQSQDFSDITAGIYFFYQGEFSLLINNSIFNEMSAKIKIAGYESSSQKIIFNNCSFADSYIFKKELFDNDIVIASFNVSQYLSAIEIYHVNETIFEFVIFDNILLDISDVSFLDLTSFIMIVGTNLSCTFNYVNISNILIMQNSEIFIASYSYIGIISFLFTNASMTLNKAIFRNVYFNSLNLGDYINEEDHQSQLQFIGGAIFLVNGALEINNSKFSDISFVSGCCITSVYSSTIIRNSFFEENIGIESASVAFIDKGNFSLSNSFLINNYAEFYDMIKTNGKGNIAIYDNYFETNNTNMKGILNFNYENIFVYGCNESYFENKENYFFQSFSCYKNQSNNIFSQKIEIKIDKSINSVEFIESLNQFAIVIDDQGYISPETIDLKIYKTSKWGNYTSNFSRNIFNLKFAPDSLNVYPEKNHIFLIGYYDPQTKINANIKTKTESVKHRSEQIFLIGIEIKQCLTGSLYNESTQNCKKCSSGTFSINPLDSSCNSCPSFGNCFDGILQPKQNYWRPNKLSSKLYFCKINPSNCMGGIDSVCKTGSVGPKCESCDYSSNYVRKLNYQCAKCDIGMLFDFLFALFIFLAQMIFLLVYIYSWYKTIELTKNNENQLEDIELVRHKKRLNIYVDVFSNYFQIISLISMLKTNKFPNFIYQFLDLAIPTAIIDTKYCLFLHINKTNTVYVDLVFIILVPFFKLFVYFIFWVVLKRKCKSMKINKNHFILGLICIYRFEVIGQVYELFSYVSCERIDGMLYMTKDPQFICDFTNFSSIYFIYFCTIMIPFIFIWVILMPFCIFYALINNNKHDCLEKEFVLERYGVLYIGYKREFYYWELFKLLTKIFFILVAKFILFDPTRILLIIIIFCVYALALAQFKPYAHQHFNRVEIFASIVYISSFLIFIYGEYSILFGRLDNTYDLNDGIVVSNSYIFSTINYLINGIFVVYLLYKMFFAVKKKTLKYYSKAKNFFNKCFEKKEKKEDLSQKFIESEENPPLSTNSKKLIEVYEENLEIQGKNDSI